ncbi:MAG: TolC family protein [Candidatus Methylomirabilia bacterium]
MTFAVAGGICALALLPGVPARGLSLEEALARAARSRFEITAVPHEIQAGEGKLLQAAVKPGPELDLETRNALEETSVGMSRTHERGGKRDARVASARAELDLLGAQADVRRLDVGHQVRKAFSAVIAAEQSLALTEESLSLTRSFAETVAAKVRAGAASPIEETRAAVRLHGAAAEIERARREVALARAELALSVGDPGVRSEVVEGRLPEDTSIPDFAALTALVTESQDLVLLEREVHVRRSLFAEERTQATPDVTWRAAANYNRLDEEASITIGVSIPLFSSGRNRGALAAASAAVRRAELERSAAERRLASELERAAAGLQAAAREAAILRSDVLTGAEQAFATVQEGYRLGKFPYLDVLDASEVLLNARLQYTGALAALAQARIDVDRLLGKTSLSSTSTAR